MKSTCPSPYAHAAEPSSVSRHIRPPDAPPKRATGFSFIRVTPSWRLTWCNPLAAPQQVTLPSVSSTQVDVDLAAISTNFPGGACSKDGIISVRPQHSAVLSARRPQTCPAPAASFLNAAPCGGSNRPESPVGPVGAVGERQHCGLPSEVNPQPNSHSRPLTATLKNGPGTGVVVS